MSNQCRALKLNGNQCQRSASNVCWQHGGDLLVKPDTQTFTTINKIGQGASGSVYWVKDKDGTNFVLKKIPKKLVSK